MRLTNIIDWRSPPPVPICQLNEIHLWHISLNISSEQQREAFDVLNESERQRGQRFYFAKHQRRFTAARAALRTILSQYLSVLPSEVDFSYSTYGKPFINTTQNPGQLQFNLSHSGEIALCAITQQYEIGIDLEQVSDRHYLDLAKRFFATDEYQALLKLSIEEQTQAFFHIWTQKEAFIKAVGEGLSYPLDEFSVSVTPPAKLLAIRHVANYIRAEAWFMHGFTILEKKYYAAVSTPQSIKSIKYWALESIF